MEQKVDLLLENINSRERNERLEEENRRLREQQAEQKREIDSLQRSREYREKVGSFWEDIKPRLVKVGLGLALVGGLGGISYGCYLGCTSIPATYREYKEAHFEEERKEIFRMIPAFIQTANYKDEKVLQEYFLCHPVQFGDNHNFLEEVIAKVFEEEYAIEKFSLNLDSYPNVGEYLGPGIKIFTAQASVNLTREGKSMMLQGEVKIKCDNHCAFVLEKKDSGLCPDYSRKAIY